MANPIASQAQHETAQTSMRCLLVVTGLFHTDGGMAALSRLTVRALAERGCQVDILSLNEQDPLIDDAYISREQARCRVFGGNKVRFALALWQAMLKKYDLIISDHVNLAAVLAPFAFFRLSRYAVWLCGIEVFPPHPDFEGRLGLRYAWKRLAISEYTRESVYERFPDLSVNVCDLALDPVKHRPAPRVHETENPQVPLVLEALDRIRHELGAQVILHVGRMADPKRCKGQDVLLWAFPAILERFPEAQLVLVGDGKDRGRLLEIAGALPAATLTRVFMPGYAEDALLETIYRSSYVFAMPSIGEGFGLVYLEAMSRGKPCLGARVDATPYVIRDGITGLLVDDPRSPKQVADALNWFLDNPALAQAMGQAGYDLVRNYYLFDHFYDRFWNALSS